MPLPPVIRHLTSRFQPHITSKTCHLRPKSFDQKGRVPGMYHNLFVTQNPPRRDEPDQGESEQGSSLLVAEKGINFRVTDVAPRTKGHMHQTRSIDFLVVHKGRITLHLEDDEKVHINEGEAIIQNGTMHAWENETDEWVRMFVVLVDTPEAPGSASTDDKKRE